VISLALHDHFERKSLIDVSRLLKSYLITIPTF